MKQNTRKTDTEHKMTIGYCRVSTESQVNNGHSLSVQKEVVKREIERHGITNSVIYEDKGISGTSDKREFYLILKDLIKEGKVDNVFLYSISRLSRNLRETLDFIDLCESNGVRVVSVWERYDTNYSIRPKITLYLLAGIAETQNDETKEMYTVRRYMDDGYGNVFIGEDTLLDRINYENLNQYILDNTSPAKQVFITGTPNRYNSMMDEYRIFNSENELVRVV